MSLSTIGLALTLIIWAIIGFGWAAISLTVVYVLAFITGLLLLFQDFLPSVPLRRRD
jgi:hypothetical protein